MILEVVIENDEGAAPSQEEVEEWADTYGLTMPVLGGGSDIMYKYAEGLSGVGLPFTVVIDPGEEIFNIASGTQVETAVGRL